MLVDAANLYFRAFYALPESITAPDGRPVNAIRGYLDMTAALIDKRRPTPARGLPRPGLAPGLPRRAGAVVQGASAGAGRRRAGPGHAGAADPGAARGAGGGRAGVHRRGRVRGRRRDRDHRGPGRRSGRDRQRRPRPARARDRAGHRAVHRQGHRQDGGDGAAGGRATSTASRPRTTPTSPSCAAIPATGCPAWPASARRPQRRSWPGSARSRTSSPQPKPARRASRPARRTRCSPPATTSSAAPGAVRGRVDADVEELDDTLPAEPADPERLVELAEELGIESSVNRLLVAISNARG